MAEQAFDIPEDLTLVSGVVVAQCIDEDGELRVIVQQMGDIHVYQAIGLLAGALDVARDQFRENFGPSEGFGS